MVKQLFNFIVAITLCFCVVGCGEKTVEAETAISLAINNISIKNMTHPTDSIFVSGQPTKEQLASLASLGIKHIINLRSADEQDWNEGQYVNSLGLNYSSIPVLGVNGITEFNANLLKAKLKAIGDEPVLVHCASGNRVGALMALSHGLASGEVLEDDEIESAISKGKQWGLAGLEPLVREKLGE